MMRARNGDAFHITEPLRGELIKHWWIHKGSVVWIFYVFFVVSLNKLLNTYVGHSNVATQACLNQVFTHKALNIVDSLEKYRVSWCPSSLCRQVISKHGIGNVYFPILRVSCMVHIQFRYTQTVWKYKNNVTYVNRIKWWLRASANTPLNPLPHVASEVYDYIYKLETIYMNCL